MSFQGEVSAVTKDGNNPYFKSKYATLENIIDTIRLPLQKNGLSFSQFPTGENELVTILMHSSGEYLQSTVKMAPKDNTPQGQGSAITYMRRYALSAILGIATEEDDDGNGASKPSAPAQKTAPVDYKKKLAAAKDIADLKKIWSALPVEAKKELEGLKCDLKLKFENEHATA